MINAKKIKYFIKENRDYFFGGLIGFVVALFPITQLFTSKFANLNHLILYIPNKITDYIINCVLCTESLILNFILLMLVYPLLGLFIAFLFRKIKHNKKPRKNK